MVVLSLDLDDYVGMLSLDLDDYVGMLSSLDLDDYVRMVLSMVGRPGSCWVATLFRDLLIKSCIDSFSPEKKIIAFNNKIYFLKILIIKTWISP